MIVYYFLIHLHMFKLSKAAVAICLTDWSREHCAETHFLSFLLTRFPPTSTLASIIQQENVFPTPFIARRVTTSAVSFLHGSI